MQFAIDAQFWWFILVGFLAQMCDGALGMGFGVVSYSVLTVIGMEPKVVSASVNAAKIVTGSASGLSHMFHKNIDWRLFARLAVGGVLGAVIGVRVLIHLPKLWVQIVVCTYMLGVGYIILSRALGKMAMATGGANAGRVGLAGGVLEAVAGVWGPLVTSSLVARGVDPRMVIGTGNLCETVVAVAVASMLVAHMGIDAVSGSILGLMTGAVIASPIAARFTRKLPARTLMIGVGVLVIVTTILRLIRLYFTG